MTNGEPVLSIPDSNIVHRSGSPTSNSEQQGVSLTGSCHARISALCSSPSHPAVGSPPTISPTADGIPPSHAVLNNRCLTQEPIITTNLSGTADKTLSPCDVAGLTNAHCVHKSSHNTQPARRSFLDSLFSHQFCNKEECPHYGAVIAPFARKCYYGPQCWRGDLDEMNAILASVLHLPLSKGRVQR